MLVEATKLYKDLSPAEFEKLAAGENVTVLDVRTAAEFESGHIPAATNLDVLGVNFITDIDSIDRSKKYLVYCRSGSRSINACVMIGSRGIAAYNLSVGISVWSGPIVVGK